MSNDNLGDIMNKEIKEYANDMAQREANGAMVYFALARMAKEQGYPELEYTLQEIGIQEANHSGFYAVLAEKFPKEIFKTLNNFMKLEYSAEEKMKIFIDKLRSEGLNKEADETELFAKQETHHGEILESLLKRYTEKQEML